MSGHSKWATIKRAKGKTDAARSKIFTKLGRELAVAVKSGGGTDPSANSALRSVIAKAKAANMPNDNIARSIKKAGGELGNINYEQIIYEGYGIGGVAVIVETLTDNKNRTAGDVRHIFDKFGGSMGTAGCVSYLFETKGVIEIEDEKGLTEDDVMMAALDAGADDFSFSDGVYEILTAPDKLTAVSEGLERAGYKLVRNETDRIPSAGAKIEGAALERFNKMLDMFDDNDDVQNVYHNAEIDEDTDGE